MDDIFEFIVGAGLFFIVVFGGLTALINFAHSNECSEYASQYKAPTSYTFLNGCVVKMTFKDGTERWVSLEAYKNATTLDIKN